MDPITIIIAILAVLLLGGLSAVGITFPPVGTPVERIRLSAGSLLATAAPAAAWVAPHGGRIVEVRGGVSSIGGTVDPTDVDLDPEIGTADILSAPIPAVNGSAIAVGGLKGTLEDTEAEITFAAGDVLGLDVTLTGGTAPEVEGAWCDIYYVRTGS